jgi:hypothetical protein
MVSSPIYLMVLENNYKKTQFFLILAKNCTAQAKPNRILQGVKFTIEY